MVATGVVVAVSVFVISLSRPEFSYNNQHEQHNNSSILFFYPTDQREREICAGRGGSGCRIALPSFSFSSFRFNCSFGGHRLLICEWFNGSEKDGSFRVPDEAGGNKRVVLQPATEQSQPAEPLPYS